MAKIFIDAGHGGSDGGAVANGLREKDLTLDIAKRIRKYLNDNFTGHTIRLSRENDRYLSLTQRTNAANAWRADVFLSVHINAGGGTGFESFIYSGGVSARTRQYQNTLHAEVMRAIGVRDRGRKRANFAVVRQTNMPAVLTECLFIDNNSDASKLKSSAFLDKLAKGHAEGLAKLNGLKRKKPAKSTNGGGLTVSQYGNLDKRLKALESEIKRKEPLRSDEQTASESHKEAWEWAISEGLTKDGRNPRKVMTREQQMTILKRFYDEYIRE